MFLFGKKKKNEGPADLSFLKADMHSHLIPGIDDGSPDLDTSLRLIRGLQQLGYSKLITTPHIMWDMYRNTPDGIHSGLAALREALRQEGITVEVEAAAEYFLDEHVEKLLKQKEPLLSFGENFVLAEFSMAFLAHGLKDIIFEMQMQGYQPVIAHPERYVYLQQSKSFFDELKDTGCLFQLNLLSLSGYYGKSVQELAQYLIKKQYYDLVGTDLHNDRYLEALHHPELSVQVRKLFDTGKIRNPEL